MAGAGPESGGAGVGSAQTELTEVDLRERGLPTRIEDLGIKRLAGNVRGYNEVIVAESRRVAQAQDEALRRQQLEEGIGAGGAGAEEEDDDGRQGLRAHDHTQHQHQHGQQQNGDEHAHNLASEVAMWQMTRDEQLAHLEQDLAAWPWHIRMGVRVRNCWNRTRRLCCFIVCCPCIAVCSYMGARAELREAHQEKNRLPEVVPPFVFDELPPHLQARIAVSGGATAAGTPVSSLATTSTSNKDGRLNDSASQPPPGQQQEGGSGESKA